MPVYEYKCDGCGAVKELVRPMSQVGEMPTCQCQRVMRRQFSPVKFTMPETGRDRVLGTLNQEQGAQDFPGGDKHRARYEEAMAKGLEPPKPVIGRGFG